jgi:hypothetical protein
VLYCTRDFHVEYVVQRINYFKSMHSFKIIKSFTLIIIGMLSNNVSVLNNFPGSFHHTNQNATEEVTFAAFAKDLINDKMRAPQACKDLPKEEKVLLAPKWALTHLERISSEFHRNFTRIL